MATLNHNDSISVFYGTYALRDAHNAAVAGDVITLSPGNFTACDISKAVTIRGVGAAYDSLSNTHPTIISDDFVISPNDSVYSLEMEAIYINGMMNYNEVYNPKFRKCIIEKYLSYNFKGNSIGTEFVNCIIKEIAGTAYSDFTFIGSVIYSSSISSSATMCLNSLLITHSTLSKLNAMNSIITRSASGGYLSGNSIAYNCIFIKNDFTNEMWDDNTNNTNMIVQKLSDVFESFNNLSLPAFSTDERYILKEEIATSFLGSDGTEVGIHGGMFPFDTRPSYMIVKKCNVANKSTIDGKLSVDIEVMVEE
ncbi:MAG: hypothetical protein IJZ87_03070 [Bacteroidales bacterium]|nr:hypothetical protein [Bacteroidales bacterium]